MVRVYTDHPELLNDLGEVIRLYLPMEEVVPAENGETAPFISAVMEESGDTWRAVCTADMDGARAEYVYIHPNVGGGELNRKRYRKRCMKIAVFRALGKVYKDTRLPWGSLTGIRPTRLLREREGFPAMLAIVLSSRLEEVRARICAQLGEAKEVSSASSYLSSVCRAL